jgi:hypothetical protein
METVRAVGSIWYINGYTEIEILGNVGMKRMQNGRHIKQYYVLIRVASKYSKFKTGDKKNICGNILYPRRKGE